MATKVRQPRKTSGSGKADKPYESAEEQQHAREEKARRAGHDEARDYAKEKASSERAKTRRAKLTTSTRQARIDADREAAKLKHRQANRRARSTESEGKRKQAAQDARNEARAADTERRKQASASARRNALFLTGSRGSVSAPSTSSDAPAIVSGPSKSTSSKVILGAMVLSSIVVAYRAAKKPSGAKTITTKDGTKLNVPVHLRQFGGVLIMGTIALIVNEIDPGLGLAFGLLILVDTGVEGLATNLSNHLFGGGSSQTPIERQALGVGAIGPHGPVGPAMPPGGGPGGPGGATYPPGFQQGFFQ